MEKHLLWDHEEHVVQVIMNDLIHERIIYGLQRLGFHTNQHKLELREAFLRLMGISEPSLLEHCGRIYDKYVQKSRLVPIEESGWMFRSNAQKVFKQVRYKLETRNSKMLAVRYAKDHGEDVWDNARVLRLLIKSDLVHLRMAEGFRELSMEMNYGTFALDRCIFWMLGIWDAREHESLAEQYYALAEAAKKIGFEDQTKDMEETAERIFHWFQGKKEEFGVTVSLW